jgi:asparagine synthetase B (glutamine-hydrolysing)
MDNLTFFDNIKKIPYGCKLVFNKKKKNIKIFKHWNLAINYNNQNDDKNLLNYNEILHYSLNKYLEKEKNKKIGLNLSGGYDSRLLLGYLSKFNPKIFSYNFADSPEIDIVKKLSENLELDLEVFQNLNFYSKYEEQIFTNTDYMMSLLHGHCFPTILKQKKSVNSVFYGHFIDMHSQSHQYNSFFFNEKNKKKIKNKLFELWCDNKSVFSIINLNTFNFLVKKGNTENYKNFIEKQLDTYSNFDGNYQYDINYFVHHGLRRAMAQLQLGANFLEFYTPALHTDFFDFVWSLPHKIKRKRNFQEMVMRTYHESLMENEYILDNYKINYLGKNFLKRFIFKSRMILKHKKISLLKPFYDSWGDVVPSLFKIELNKLREPIGKQDQYMSFFY